MSIEEIVAKLERNDGSFPRRALEIAIEEQEIVTPRLLQEIEYAVGNVDEIDADATYMLHIYALYLLAQFREKKAYPLIAKFFTLPGDTAQEVTGDVVTEDLGRILASTFDGNVEIIKEIVENKDINEYTRSAAIHAICILWGQNSLSRQLVVDYFHCLMTEKLVGEHSSIWSALITHSLSLSPDELEEEIEKVFDQNLVEPFYVGREDFRGSLGLPAEEALRRFRRDRRSSLIEDTVAELENWACFQTKKKHLPKPAVGKKVGRNDPCICGSGKKYKKCCLH